ncbi:MAG TPA: TPM domain-containing protein, partial [Thermomicrobiales bacterium]|nr:TPM domain-containing protein [Thermomicrobiales bacterium]
MTGRFSDNLSNLRHLIRPILAMIVLWVVASPGIALGSAGTDTIAPPQSAQTVDIPVRNSNPAVRVEDPSGLLTAQQFQILNATLDRLARLGTEAVVFFQVRDDEFTSQPWLADDLRLAWGVESSVGARDGLVIVVSVDRGNPANSTIATSSGLNTFPIRQLTTTGFDSLVEDVAVPQIQSGDAYSGV